MQGFRGTICRVREHDYLLRRLNGRVLDEVTEAKRSLDDLTLRLERVIKNLSWKDFELLVDLIFRNAGWQRVSALGSTIKSLDLELTSPITSERYGVQVKSKATLQEFNRYYDDRLINMPEFDRFYFVVHSPEKQLAEVNGEKYGNLQLPLPFDVARLATQYGLAQWIIDKAS